MFKNPKTLKLNKTVFAVALILLLTVSSSLAILPSAMAAAVPDRNTGAYMSAAPKLIGLGQELTCNAIIWPAPAGPTLYSPAVNQIGSHPELTGQKLEDLYSNSAWHKVTVTFTKPDGTVDSFMPLDASLHNVGLDIPGMTTQLGTLLFYYKPDQVGTWTVTCSFPGQTITTPPITDTVFYKASTSKATTFTVQADPVNAGILNGWPYSQLPNNYWERPVNTNNREWYSISGDWLQSKYDALSNAYNPYSTAPNSAHIIWKNTAYMSGIVGGEWGSLAYGEAGTTQIVMDGMVIYNEPSGNMFRAVDLRTGELIYRATGSINLGQHILPFFQTVAQTNEGGVAGYLWGFSGSSWLRYDAFTGALLQTIANAPTDLQTRWFEEGNPVVICTQRNGWNTTLPLRYAWEGLIRWDYTKVTNNDWRTGVVWNVSVRQPDGFGVGDGRNSVQANVFSSQNVVIVKGHSNENSMIGFDYTTGKYLWRTTVPEIEDLSTLNWGGANGPLLWWDSSLPGIVAFDVKTGQQIWTRQLGVDPWNVIDPFNRVAYGNTFYVGLYDGYVYAVDMTTGNIKWQSDYAGDTTETIYGTLPFGFAGLASGADGKLFFNSANVYQLEPRSRFQRLFAIDANTGKFMWTLSGAIAITAIADGYMVGVDQENGVMYGIGKGQTATSVTIQNDVIAKGAAALIKGSVTDQSPSQKGTPAVSDDSMSEWMDYLHMQNATLINSPPTPKGVQVKLTAVDSSGARQDIGTVNTDSKGQYSTMWTPTSAGVYTIVADFSGTNSYWSSQGETQLGVTQAAATPAPSATPSTATVEQQQSTNMYILAVGVVLIILVIVAIVLLVRKRQ
jgi:outer membrane protein assembly factor BamB